ncbi:lycopene beta-cyclase CrtY [Sphingosinicella terrae]|uniref:lycopene beta-cyclase CrtY n=1 Tax=Sphingosinicella terrae TaxID=2172047 RepID=UPI0013B3899E|nr:lycopene beta-cyclase CrtY [Sphingosinicella terrae]
MLIAGGGVAGCLAALAMVRLRPEIPLMIVEERPQFGGDGFHLLFEAELEPAELGLVQPIASQSWPGFYIAFPELSRNLKSPLLGIEARSLHRAMVEALQPDQYRLGTRIVAVRGDALELEGGETIRAEGAIDARGAANLSMLDLLWETRIERSVRLTSPHGLDRPLLIDGTVDQGPGFNFVQAFPIGDDRLRLAQVLISEQAQPDQRAQARLANYLSLRRWKPAEADSEVATARPLPTGGDFGAFWRIGGARVAKLGLRGGFVQPATGRTLPDAVRNALLLARQRDFSGEALHDNFESEARAMWKKRELARQINASIARSPSGDRRELAQRLWRLDAATILRLQTERLGLLDRRKVQQVIRR